MLQIIIFTESDFLYNCDELENKILEKLNNFLITIFALTLIFFFKKSG